MEDTITPEAEERAVLINHLSCQERFSAPLPPPPPPPFPGEVTPEGIRPGELLLALTSGSTLEGGRYTSPGQHSRALALKIKVREN